MTVCMMSRGHVVIAALLAAMLAASAAAGHGATLLSSSVPGAFGVRYLPDRAVVTYTVGDPRERAVAARFRLRVLLPEPVRWGFLDREPIADDSLNWLTEDGQVMLALPFGSHRLHLGWAGEPSLPPERAVVPVLADGREVGRLVARFTIDGMEATGEVTVGPGIAALRLDTVGAIDADAVSLAAAGETVGPWTPRDGALVAPERLLIGENPALALNVHAYGLSASPIARVVFEDITAPANVQRVPGDQVPDEALLAEAEAFVDAGGTPVQIEPGSHHDAHGGSCVYSFIGDGSWLEWDLDAPADGSYDLYARVSCGDTGAFRVVAVDGEVPEGLELVAFPGTGGWGHAEGEWWLVRLTGAEGSPAPLELTAGTHRLRVTGVLRKHLNFDFVLLVPHE